MPIMLYATPEDLINYLDPVPDNAEILIRRASRLVDNELLSAVYDVDEEGLPTDPKVAQALLEATCEQVAAWDEGGETGTGAADHHQTVKIGSAQLTRGGASASGSGKTAAASLAPQALLVLRQAGLTGHAPKGR